MDRIETLALLEGCEIRSIRYEGTVTVRRSQIVRDGIVIDAEPSNADLAILFDELLEQEGVFGDLAYLSEF